MGSSNFGSNIWTTLSILLLFASLGTAQYAGASFEEDTGEAMSTRSSEKKPALRSKSVGPRKGLGKALVVDAQDAIDEASSSEEITEEASEDLPAEEEEVAEVAEDAAVEEEEVNEEAPAEESEEGLEESPVEEEVGEESPVEEEEEAADEEGEGMDLAEGVPDGMQKVCGTEPHSDVGGFAVVFGIGHRQPSPAACCQSCQDHAAKGGDKPCNSWVFCPEPVCWGLDTGWNHTFGECWLKWQEDPTNPIYGQRGDYTEEFHEKFKHVRGGPPKAVPWMGGVIGQPVDHKKKWMTGPKGIQAASGEKLRVWRAWLNDFEPEK